VQVSAHGHVTLRHSPLENPNPQRVTRHCSLSVTLNQEQLLWLADDSEILLPLAPLEWIDFVPLRFQRDALKVRCVD
jgi:hypothetical protein